MGLDLLDSLYLLRVKKNEDGEIIETTNLTLLNLWLLWFGPLREDRLAIHIVGVQLLCGVVALLVRHKLALLVFREDNRGPGYVY